MGANNEDSTFLSARTISHECSSAIVWLVLAGALKQSSSEGRRIPESVSRLAASWEIGIVEFRDEIGRLSGIGDGIEEIFEGMIWWREPLVNADIFLSMICGRIEVPPIALSDARTIERLSRVALDLTSIDLLDSLVRSALSNGAPQGFDSEGTKRVLDRIGALVDSELSASAVVRLWCSHRLVRVLSPASAVLAPVQDRYRAVARLLAI